MPTPAERLRLALAPLSRRERVALGKRAGVGPDAVNRAAAGIAVNASRYIRLCAAAGISVTTGARIAPQTIENFNWRLFALGVRVNCRLRSVSRRTAVKLIGEGVSPATLSRLDHGKEISINGVIAICRWMGVPPEHYARTTEPELSHGKRKSETTGAAA